MIEVIAFSAAFLALVLSGDIAVLVSTWSCPFLIILVKSRESFQKTSATIIYNTNYFKKPYSEKERKIGHCHWNTFNRFLHTPIRLVSINILEEEPNQVHAQWKNNSDNQNTECPSFDFFWVQNHENCWSADCQVDKICSEK